MAARVIDLSELSDRQRSQLGRRMGKSSRELRKLRYREEPIDEGLFSPLAKAIAHDVEMTERIEERFRETRLKTFCSCGRSKNHYSYYLGFLFETAIQMSVLKYSQDNPEMLSVLHDSNGMLGSGRLYAADAQGSVVFYKPADGGRTLQTIAEIDLVGEIRSETGTIPVIFEITLMNNLRKDFKIERKAALLEEIYGRKPYFCIVRPAYDGEEPGVHLRFNPERGVYRDILIPRSSEIRALAGRLLDEEHGRAEKAGLAASGA